MTALTSDIANFVATVDPARMPERANFGARIGMLDCVGTMIAGANEEAVKIVAQIVPAYTGNDGAPEIPGGRNLSAGDAALVNGVSQIAPFDAAAKQALIEAPDLATRCEMLVQLMQFFGLGDPDENRVTLQ